MMLALEKWGRGRYKPLVMFAHSVGLGAEATYCLCQKARQPKFREFLARIEDKSAWLENYQGQGLFVMDPRFAKEVFAMVADEELAEKCAGFLDEIRLFQISTPQERKDLARKCAEEIHEAKLTWVDLFGAADKFTEAMDEVYQLYLEWLREELKGANAEDDAAWVALLKNSTRARFFFLVTVPCWIEFGKSPSELFEQAQAGDFDCLCQLLNVDLLCLSDTQVFDQFQKQMQSNEVRQKMLLRAMEYKPLRKLKKQAIKVLCAALVYKVFNRVHDFSMEWQKKLWESEANHLRVRRHELTFAAVQKLFDAAYKDVHGTIVPDPDFSGITPDAFALSVKRALPFWEQI